ncbi:hypothetical protein G4228_016252 [Cervus hanglu yarkandensis]|nr:hypothetical protein G4228_016252 [Cervus hanglu yarkandensis]
MFRRARLSVKPNVRPGAGARASTAPSSQREQEVPRPPEPAAASAPKPAESTDVPPVDFGEAEPQEKTPKSCVEKTDDGKDVEESSKPSSTVSQRRKRIPSTSSLVKPSVSVPSEPHPLSTVNREAPQPNPVPAKEKQPCSDRYRIYKAQKLREMLKEELKKEKKQWKNKYAVNETQRPPDRSKMTMRDFIYYLPESNPMTSSLEQEKKTEKSSTPVRTREQEGKTTPDGEDNEEIEEELDDGPLLVPRVKVAEDGSIILDEESLTVEVLRTKGPCVVEENDPIFERGSTTTYSSFRKSYYSKPWSNKETDMFFLAISMVGTDFSMIGQLFPHRARIEIKNKFKREEKTNGWRIDKAFQEKRPFDFDFFAHLLQKVLAEEEKRKQKSVKNQCSKEKKSSKSRKNVKVKKVANDDRDESVSPKISNPGRSQKDAQTVEEELQSLTLSEQNSEQNALELDVNQKKRRRKNQGEGSEQEVHLSGSATVQPGSSKGEKHKNKGLSLSPEINEDEASKEQEFPCVQDTDDLVGLSSSEDAEKRTDPVLSSSQQDVISVTAETAESNTSDSPSSEGGVRALCEVKCAESSCTEERDVDLKSKSLETDQTETVKPMTRGRLQRPKPNLSRAVGKKSVLSRAKTDAEDKSLHKETPVEKTPEQIEDQSCENFECEDVASLSGKRDSSFQNVQSDEPKAVNECLSIQEDNRANKDVQIPKTRFQKPKPNIGRRTGRRGISSKEEVPKEVIASEEMTEALSETARLETSLREKEPVESNATKEMESDLKEIERKDISSRDIMPEMSDVAAEMETDLKETEKNDISPREKMPEIIDVTEEMRTDLKETEKNDISSMEKIPEMIDVIAEMETDSKKTGKNDISSREKMPEMSDVIAEVETDLKETEKNDVSPREKMPEMNIIAEMEADLKETGKNDISPRETVPEMIDVTAEMGTDLKETGKNYISPREEISEMSDVTVEMKTDLKEIGKNDISPREKMPEMSDVIAEMETNLKEIRKKDISSKETVPEMINVTAEMGTDLKETEKNEISSSEKIPETNVITAEMETDLKETGKNDISPREKMPEMIDVTAEMETDLKGTGKNDISPREKMPEMNVVTAEMETDLKGMGKNDISPREKIPEMSDIIAETETDLKETRREVFPREEITVVTDATEERETDLEETERREMSLQENAPEEVDIGEVETGLKKTEREISPNEEIPEMPDAAEEVETDLEETDRREISTQENASEVKTVGDKMEIDLKETGIEISPGEKVLVGISATGERETDLEETGQRDVFLMEKASGKVAAIEEIEADLTDTGKEISLMKSRSEEIEESLADLENIEKIDISLREKEPEETGTSGRAEADSLQTSSGDDSTVASLSNRDLGREVLSVFHTSVEEKNSEKEVSSQLSHLNISSQSSELDKIEDQRMRPPSVPEQFSDINLRTHNINTFEQGIKERVIQTAPLVRGRLQRPRPNLRKAGPRQVIEKSETRETTKEEKTLQKDETGKKFLPVPNSQIATEIEVVSSEVSEGRMSENQSQVLLENLHINKVDVLGEKMRHGHETYVPSPPQMVRRQFQRAKPNLGRAQSKKEASDIEEDRADQRKAKPEDSLSQREDSDSQLLQKGKPEFLTSPEVSARKDSVGSKETGLAKEDAPSEVEPSGSVGEKTGGDNSVCAVVEKQCISKPSSPQLLKEPDNSRIVLDRRRALSSASEREIDHSRRRVRRKVKPSIPKGRGSKRSRSKTSKKEPRAPRSVLVTLRASQEEDEDDSEDFESDYEEESYHLAPEEVNKAPVFVPIGLRSPEPVPVQIEETMEEEVTVGEHSQADTENTNDGSTEAAIALLTMGDLVLQSEISPEQSDGICILPDAPSVAQSHIPFSPDNANLKSVHECQEPSSPVRSTSPSVEENMTVLDVDKQNTKEEIGLTEEVKESTTSSRTTTFEVTNNLRRRSRFAKPKPNLKKILGTKRFGAHQKVPSLFVTKGEEVEIQRDSEKNASQETELEDKNLGSVTAAESAEQSKVASVHGVEETSISQETHLTERGEEQEGRSEEVQISSVAPAVSSESGPHTLGLGMGLGESSVEEALGKDFNGDPVLTLNVPKCIPTNIPEVQQENVNNLQDLTVNLVNVHQDGEDEQAFILTLVEIPTHAVEEYADSTMQLMPNPLLPAPILVKSVNTKEREDTRPGRRPLGFLSLICSKNSLDSDEPTQVHSKKRLKPVIPVSRQNLKRSNLPSVSQKKTQESSDVPSRSVVDNTQPTNNDSSATQVSSNRPLPKGECKGGQNRVPEEEPTTVSEYFFNDIFIEVDEPE